MLHNFFTNPSLLIPSLLFPLFFFTAFAGGLSRDPSVPGFDFPPGLHGLPVRVRAAPVGGVRRRLHRLRHRARLRERLRAPAAARRAATAAGSCSATRSPPSCAGSSPSRSSTVVALAGGMQVGGSGVDLFGLVLARRCSLNVAARALGGGRRDAPADACRPARHADAGLPRFSSSRRSTCRSPARGLDPRGRGREPAHALIEAGRGFISGEPEQDTGGVCDWLWPWPRLLRLGRAGVLRRAEAAG